MIGIVDNVTNEDNNKVVSNSKSQVYIENLANSLTDMTKNIVQNTARTKEIEYTMKKLEKKFENIIDSQNDDKQYLSSSTDIINSGITLLEIKMNEQLMKINDIQNICNKFDDMLQNISKIGDEGFQILQENRRLLKEIKDVRISITPPSSSPRTNMMSPRGGNMMSPRSSSKPLISTPGILKKKPNPKK